MYIWCVEYLSQHRKLCPKAKLQDIEIIFHIGIIRKESNQPAVHPENCLLMHLWYNSFIVYFVSRDLSTIEYVGGPSQVKLESISTTSKLWKFGH